MAELRFDDKVVEVDRALSQAGIRHAFGGAICLAYYAEPRATIDIDVNVFVPEASAPAVLEAMSKLGMATGRAAADVARSGQCRLNWGPNPVDLFFANLEFHDAMARAARLVPYPPDVIPILAPEHLMVCKALFNRPKDWLDIEQMLVTVADLRVREVRRWMDEIAGPDDARTQRLDALIREMLAR